MASSLVWSYLVDLYAYLEVAFSARVDDKRVYIIGHPVDDDDGGVTDTPPLKAERDS